MNGPILLLVVCYALLALLLLALCLYTRWSFFVKTAAIVLLTGFYFLSYEALTGMLGYPTPARLPQRFVFHGAMLAEPNKNTGEKGAMYLWITAIGRDGPVGEPRAYVIPWDKEIAKNLGEASRRSRDGIIQMGEVLEEPPAEGVSGVGQWISAGQQKFKVQDVPEPALPEK
jgi:hypothetical protein